MSSSLVYLHIPKSAGSSHRGYLSKVFGEDALFWYGLHSEAKSFNAAEVGTSFVLGGHRPLSFYPRSLDSLYTSVVRDPVERAVSFFNYCIDEGGAVGGAWHEQRQKEIIKWQKKGIDSSSLSRSIERCKPFRKMVSNLQCSYLSRYEPTFEGVLKTLEEESMVIGVFDKLPLFNDFLKTELNFPIDNRVRSNIGREGYSSDIFNEVGVASLIRSVNIEDQLLYDFVRFARGGLYVGANNIDAVRGKTPTGGHRSKSSSGIPLSQNKIQLFNKGFLQVLNDGTVHAAVAINNAEKEPLIFSKPCENSCAVGWLVKDETGAPIEGLRGIVEIERTIQAGKVKVLSFSFSVDRQTLQNNAAVSVEFSIVSGGVWLNQKYPMSSASSVLFLTV